MDSLTYGNKMLFTITQYPAVESSLFDMKITVKVTKSSHLDQGLCYLHLSIFFFCVHSSLLQQNKKLLQSLFFLSKLDHRPLFSYIYYKTILM